MRVEELLPNEVWILPVGGSEEIFFETLLDKLVVRVGGDCPWVLARQNAERNEKKEIGFIPGLVNHLKLVAALALQHFGGPVHANGVEVLVNKFENNVAINVRED